MLNDSTVSEDYDNDQFYQAIGGGFDLASEFQEEQKLTESNQLFDEEEGVADQQIKEEQVQQIVMDEEQKELQAEQLQQQQERIRVKKLGLQNSVNFDIILGSFSQFVEEQQTQINQMRIKTFVENNVVNGQSDYFNFGLNTTTWRMFVNKQILMRYERLFIEKQMNEVKQRKTDLERQLATLDADIQKVKREQENVKNAGNASAGQGSNPSHQSQHQQNGGNQMGHRPDRRRKQNHNNPGMMNPFGPNAMMPPFMPFIPPPMPGGQVPGLVMPGMMMPGFGMMDPSRQMGQQ
ncbi:UNKNOWN [Stylonychia lemnae]|uniref:Pre-mRNA polyadenylation factor Fip1 domain-containing protein n=1 Tax=Stylonychia lemnae TaxID=5949 RepID=A0A078A8C4_STYLE|nr:UNKNOWN [Stylonychia lemnae]|eukprot:CDW78510.1 UNKNOWN [Stylonychia lemnae]